MLKVVPSTMYKSILYMFFPDTNLLEKLLPTPSLSQFGPLDPSIVNSNCDIFAIKIDFRTFCNILHVHEGTATTFENMTGRT